MRSNCSRAMSTIPRPITREAVAAGDGTFETCSRLREPSNRKSSTSAPFSLERLGTDPRRCGHQIGAIDLRHELLQGMNKCMLIERAIELSKARAPMFPGERELAEHFSQGKIGFSVLLTLQSEYRIRAGVDMPVHSQREMHPRKGKRGSGTG